jgi:phosphatidylglycerophosphatase A
MRKIVLFVATGAGSGYSPIAPGTAGSAVGLLLYALLAGLPTAGYALAVAATAVVGVWAADRAERIFARKDDGRITVDEVAGMLVSLVALPVRLDVAVSAFFLFRLFDIIKPPPIRTLERLEGGLGVVADDLAAGIYANVVGQILWRVVFPEGVL